MTPVREGQNPTLARVGAAQTLAALRAVDAGRVYDLGMPIDPAMPMGPAGAFVPFSTAFSATPAGTRTEGSNFHFAAEAVIGCMHTSTHIDALVHVAIDGEVYGDVPYEQVLTDRGFSVHGVDTIAPIIGRGVVIDVAGAHGVAALDDGYEITVADLEQALAASGTTIAEGDIVLVRTGKIREFFADPAKFGAGQPGVGPDAAIWLYEQGMAVLGTDTTSTEAMPFPDPYRTTHGAMLKERGVHLIENLMLDEVGTDGVATGAFICTPLKITGATGSWVRPILVI
jgi:kynurenine formamidase